MNIRKEVIRQSNQDAADHQAEFPGQPLRGDWDAEAYGFACTELGLFDAERDEFWIVYRNQLIREVDRIRRERHAITEAVAASRLADPQSVVNSLCVTAARGDSWRLSLDAMVQDRDAVFLGFAQ